MNCDFLEYFQFLNQNDVFSFAFLLYLNSMWCVLSNWVINNLMSFVSLLVIARVVLLFYHLESSLLMRNFPSK